VHEAQQQQVANVHSTYAQAAEVALHSGARRLVLVHLPPDVRDDDLVEARRTFENVEFGEDGGRYDF
jgi:ribonuclease Z